MEATDDGWLVVDKVVVPALENIGQGWEEGRVSLSQVYMAGRICEGAMGEILPADRPASGHQYFTLKDESAQISAVLFLLGPGTDGKPVLILNKRSRHVRQPSDLCCPGGGVRPALDSFLARWLRLPAPPLSRWPKGFWWRR